MLESQHEGILVIIDHSNKKIGYVNILFHCI